MANKLSFESRVKAFEEELEALQKKYDLYLYAGYINPSDDDNNLIVADVNSNEKEYIDN